MGHPSRFSALSFIPAIGSGNQSEAIWATALTEGAKLITAGLFKIAGSSEGVTATGMASFIPTGLATALDAQAKSVCSSVSGANQTW